MLEFISRNSDTISAVTNILFLAVWAVYLQIFLLEFRRERKPRVILHQTGELDLDSFCMISNMSREPVDIVLITAVVRCADGKEEHLQITDRRRDPNPDHLKDATNQGPLRSGDYIGLTRFRSLLDWLRENGSGDADTEDLRAVEIRVVFTYGPGAKLNGARRSFRVSRSDDSRIWMIPEVLNTEQIRGWRERKTLSGWLRESLPDR